MKLLRVFAFSAKFPPFTHLRSHRVTRQSCPTSRSHSSRFAINSVILNVTGYVRPIGGLARAC